ncbi:E1-E2 ATPase-domain-containing protein [Kalaharituber pfeilii]|nr:E1-E2 ATPase-domain-containing protein [Kalaharituber pfeilii]
MTSPSIPSQSASAEGTNAQGGRLDAFTGSASQALHSIPTPAGTQNSTGISTPGQDMSNIRHIITTTLLISNLHCSSCSTTIRLLLEPLSPPPLSISTNIVTQDVTIVHLAELNPQEILKVLLEAEFEIDSVHVCGPDTLTSPGNISSSRTISINHVNSSERGYFLGDWGDLVKAAFESGKKRKRHIELCEACRCKQEKLRPLTDSSLSLPLDGCSTKWGKGHENVFMGHRRGSGESFKDHKRARGEDVMLINRTGDASYGVPAVSRNDSGFQKSQSTPQIVPITPGIVSATRSSDKLAALRKEVAGEVALPNEDIDRRLTRNIANNPIAALYEATFSIEGMTCSTCTGKVNEIIGALPGVKNVDVALMTNSATVRFEGTREDVEKIVDEVESIGYGCTLNTIKGLAAEWQQKNVLERTIQIKVEGMFCESCPIRVLEAISAVGGDIKIQKVLTITDPILEITYLPNPPDFTIRRIISTLDSLNPAFTVTIYHPPTIEERSRHIQRTELRRFIIRAILCIIIAIPTFMIGIVWMSLVPKDNKIRQYWESQMWSGRATRLEWALFFLSTPVQFVIADVFHVRAIKEIRSLWRKGSTVPILRRFYRFGSMNLLISLGVSIAYFASVALLAIAATTDGDAMGHHTTYFDSTVFLTMFLLLGRCLEAYSKAKTADAVSMLGKLRPTEALLLLDGLPAATSSSAGNTHDLVEKDDVGPSSSTIKKIPVDMLEVGDTIVVQHGGSPPADGKIVMGQTKFDESSLTGEARPVQKVEGDEVFAGTINKGRPVHVVISAVSGESMLDQIVKVVREGQTRRAPIERVADVITGYFVPVVTLIAICTWIIWLSLGMSGTLQDYWLDIAEGSWPVWSLGFAIAVFVVACPCGIGLAAPTALFVGSGLAAKHGILAKGGGEAFQEASWLDCIVFDKTGTLTEGGEPKVTDEEVFITAGERIEMENEVRKLVYAFAVRLEDMSSHPLARAIVAYCEGKEKASVIGSEVEEVPGRGLKGVFTIKANNGTNDSYEAIIGNEPFMTENGVPTLDEVTHEILHGWKSKGKSVVLLAIKKRAGSSTLSCFTTSSFTLSAAFAAMDPLRPEASYVIRNLRASGISVWMISGDNPITAVAVAGMVGIPRENVIAGVLPTEKADKILYLQNNAPKRSRSRWFHNPFSSKEKASNAKQNKRAIVAMVGDGINDAPALTVSDVGIAIGSGSDIAIGSAKFILVSSNLNSLLTLTDLSRKVFRRVKFNFFWACVYNMIALPVAAGVLYPVGMRNYTPPAPGHDPANGSGGHGMSEIKGPQRIRLEPVWASLAMALSSVSVVCSSLLLKTTLWGVGFRPRRFDGRVADKKDAEMV